MELITTPGAAPQTMTSREMADLTEKRHDSVKRTIDTLAANGVISQPQIVDGEKAGNNVVEKPVQQPAAVGESIREGFEQAASAIAARALGWRNLGDDKLADELLQCRAMLHDMKPAAPAAGVQGDDVLLRTVTELAKCIWRDNYKSDAPQWEPLPDVMGVVSQIDNMVCGMRRAAVDKFSQPDSGRDAALVDEADLECQVPPFGWRCTRGAGHSGPCAAVECPEDVAAVKQGMERLAAHPANGAQAGLSDAIGNVIKGEIRSAYNEGYSHGKADGDRTASRFVPGNVVAECWAAILAAAKKGGAA